MAITEVLKKEGIVLRVTETKEHDAMVLCIGEEGLFSFYARGIKKMNSSNGSACQELSYSRFELSKNSGGLLSLKEASPIKLLLPAESLDGYTIASLMLELTTRLLSAGEGEAMYPWLKTCLEALANGKDPYVAGLLYFAKILIQYGIGLDVDECVACSSRSHIKAVSYIEGGFLCANCLAETGEPPSSEMELKIIRYIFKAPIEDVGRVSLGAKATLPVYASLGKYLTEMTGSCLKTLDFLSPRL